MTELTADVVVVGAGAAGIPCAIAAAELGAHVVVLEKTDRIGGTLWVSGGHLSGARTRRQRERGIVDTPEDHFAEVARLSHGLADEVLLRAAIEAAPATIDWLEDLGFAFAPEAPSIWYAHEPYAVARTYWGEERGRSVLAVLRRAFETAVQRGEIELLLSCPMRSLWCSDGEVIGVRAQAEDGRPVTVRGPVALTSGGYAGSLELLAAAVPDARPAVAGAPVHASGDGLRAGQEIGAAVRGMEHQLANVGGIETEAGSRRVDIRTVAASLTPQYRTPREILVNADGERFIAEDEPSVDRQERALAAQPGQQAWAVFAEASLPGEPLVAAWQADGLRAAAREGGRAWSADTLHELAARAGIDPGGLEATVIAYNAAIAVGVDAMGRQALGPPIAEPPFYAVRVHATHYVSFGGLVVDEWLRVLDETGAAIVGLYAAGEVIGAATMMGDAFAGGMCVTPAVTFGRRLGADLATAGHDATPGAIL